MLFRDAQSASDEIQFVGRCRDASFRLLLKTVQYIDRAGETYRVDTPKRIAVKIVHDLQNAPPAKSFERLCRGMLLAILGIEMATPMKRLTSIGNALRSFLLVPI